MADEKLSELTTATLPLNDTDLFYVVQNSTSSSSLSRRVTFVDLSSQVVTGEITSVALSMPAFMSVSGSPITAPGGTIDVTASSTGSGAVVLAGSPTFTGTVAIPTLNLTLEVLSPCTEVTMSGTLTLVAGTSTTYQFLNPNSSDRQVNLPVAATGITYFIMHIGAANTITIKDNGGSTVASLGAGQFYTFVYSGSAWRFF